MISFNSRFASQTNPNLLTKVDVAVRSPPGSYYLSDLYQTSTKAIDYIKSLVRHHVTPVSAIPEIAESLASDLHANLPPAIKTRIVFHLNTPNKHQGGHLRALCSFQRFATQAGQPTNQNSTYQTVTRWRLPPSILSWDSIYLFLFTQERSVSTVCDRMSGLESPNLHSSLSRVHPTFDIHEDIARLAEQPQSNIAEGVAILLAQRLFQLADEQSPCKRLQIAQVGMSREYALTEQSRTEREQVAERTLGKNNASISCVVRLDRDQYEQSQRSLLSSDVPRGRHRAYLALGSNLGNRVETIESALREMSNRGLTVLRTSALYETKPMYLEDQDAFINGACEVCATDAVADVCPR